MGVHASIYAFLGPDYHQKTTALEGLQKKHSEAECLRYSILHNEIEALLDSLHHQSLYATHRILSVTHSELLTNKKHIQALEAYCKNPSPDITLVFMSESWRLAKPLERYIPKDNMRVFWEKRHNQQVSWLMAQAARAECSLDQDAAEFLAETTGGFQKDLNETLQLLLSLGKRRISRADIETLPLQAKHETIFSLIDACCAQDATAALRILQQLLHSKESPVSIVVRMQLHFRKLHTIAIRMAQGMDFKAAHAGVGIAGKRSLEIASRYIQLRSLADINTVLLSLYQSDGYLRSYPELTHQTILELGILHVIHNRSWSTGTVLPAPRMTAQL